MTEKIHFGTHFLGLEDIIILHLFSRFQFADAGLIILLPAQIFWE